LRVKSKCKVIRIRLFNSSSTYFLYILFSSRAKFLAIQEIVEDILPISFAIFESSSLRLSPHFFCQSKNRARQWGETATSVSHSMLAATRKRCKLNLGERSARRGRKVPRPLSGSLFYLAPCYMRRNVFYCVLSQDKLLFICWRHRVVPNFI